jgi:hypothetical protein
MPGDRLALAGRARSRSETRMAGPGPLSGVLPSHLESAGESGGESAGESDSETGSETQRPQRASKLHLICPGCNKPFSDRTSLRRHRSAWKTADPACRKAAHKRPRTVRLDVDSAQDANDRIRRMMGDGPNSRLASGPAVRDAQSPFLQPIDEVGPGDRNGLTRRHKFTQCLQMV